MKTIIFMRKTYVAAPADPDDPCRGCAAFEPTETYGHQFNDPLCAALPCVPLDEPHIIFKELT